MKKSAVSIVATIILSSYSAIAFDGGRGMQIALTEHDENNIILTAPLDGQEKLSITGCEKLLGFPKDGSGQITLTKEITGQRPALIAAIGPGL